MSKGNGARSDSYHPGQVLRARDLQGGLEAARQLRWWHTVALHNVWGIVEGLEVVALEDQQTVEVKPGLAYDNRGRELLLAEPVEVGVPPDTPRVVLVALHETVRDLQSRAACPESRAGGLGTGPGMTWRAPDSVRLGLEVPLVAVQLVQYEELRFLQLDPTVRAYAQRVSRPYLVRGRTQPGVGWEAWSLDGEQLGWSIHVDTSAAGFVREPHYFASLDGDLFADSDDAVLPSSGLFTFIMNAHYRGFTLVVSHAAMKGGPVPTLLHDPPTPPVAWMAVEDEIACGANVRFMVDHAPPPR